MRRPQLHAEHAGGGAAEPGGGASAGGARGDACPEVDGARTLADFVPADQPAKLAAISDAAQNAGSI